MNRISNRKRERDEKYLAIRKGFLQARSKCEVCPILRPTSKPNRATDIHHKNGKAGELYFQIHLFIPSCRRCHQWIGDHPKEARELGLIGELGTWNTPQTEPKID